ncbi:efflux RND transporter periplasmic adaptor subunit [Rheinheimera riviphila]|uniref:Efflux RND transporter periplasmic adaptor subunit n=1 Tax=Rheinheimera riviphila TaxID=1834037 RepID=A0A437QIV0_9GAMM|nr:efflux RND transporter periplasmic adaptor subunit [Rheinheimera riviphila]
MRCIKLLLVIAILFQIYGCSEPTVVVDHSKNGRWVKTLPLQLQQQHQLEFTGVLRARTEVPLAFQVSGRLQQRLIEPGQLVRKGQLLLQLDPKDLTEAVRVAQAGVDAAKASVNTMQAELTRTKALIKKGFISDQALEQVQLKFNEASANQDRSQAQLEQARHALTYAKVHAPDDGIITQISSEPGQVVTAGQPMASLATVQQAEVEIQLPENLTPPGSGTVLIDGQSVQLELRSFAGSADPQSLSRQARYRLLDAPATIALGRVVQVHFQEDQSQIAQVPVGALDERGVQPQIWQVTDGKVQASPVEILVLEGEMASIRTSLTNGSHVVVLGAHLLQPEMAVQELPQ